MLNPLHSFGGKCSSNIRSSLSNFPSLTASLSGGHEGRERTHSTQAREEKIQTEKLERSLRGRKERGEVARLRQLMARRDDITDIKEVEELIELMEGLSALLTDQEKAFKLTHQRLLSTQITEAGRLLDIFNAKNTELIECLKKTRDFEAKRREEFDALCQRHEKAKKTLRVAFELALSMSTAKGREETNLDSLRDKRSERLRDLEDIVNYRNTAQRQIFTIGVVSQELRKRSITQRDYLVALQAAQGGFFRYSFGEEFQNDTVATLTQLMEDKEKMKMIVVRVRDLRKLLGDLRKQISHLICEWWN